MKRVKLVELVLVVISFLVPTSGLAGPVATEDERGAGTVAQQVSTLQAQLLAAILRSDTGFLERCFADDYVVIHGNGTLSTKTKEIENFRSGATRYDSIEVREPLKVRVYGDTAIVNELASVKATFNGKPYSGDVRNTRVWVRQKGDWKVVTFQATRVPSASQ